jgi:transcription initiation factor IIE alpha subunit
MLDSCCDNPPCVNPAHLFVGTHQDNIDDMVSKGRHLVERVQLTSEAREQMRAEYQKGGVTHPDLAEKYGISLNTVGRILRGE